MSGQIACILFQTKMSPSISRTPAYQNAANKFWEISCLHRQILKPNSRLPGDESPGAAATVPGATPAFYAHSHDSPSAKTRSGFKFYVNIRKPMCDRNCQVVRGFLMKMIKRLVTLWCSPRISNSLLVPLLKKTLFPFQHERTPL